MRHGMEQARAQPTRIWCSSPDPALVAAAAQQAEVAARAWFQGGAPLRTAIVRQQLFFPDRRLLQYDCGKLQVCVLHDSDAGLHLGSSCTARTSLICLENWKSGLVARDKAQCCASLYPYLSLWTRFL